MRIIDDPLELMAGFESKASPLWRRDHLDWRFLHNGIAAGAVGALLSGAPSTIHALLSRENPLEASLAAGSMVLSDEGHPLALLLAAAPVHIALSVGWGVLLSAVLPRQHEMVLGTLAGGAIAALDLGLIGRRFPRVRALPMWPQVADHLVYGGVVGTVLRRRRAARAGGPQLDLG